MNRRHLLCAFALTALFGAFAIVRHADEMRSVIGEDVSKRYVENIARLEMKREE